MLITHWTEGENVDIKQLWDIVLLSDHSNVLFLNRLSKLRGYATCSWLSTAQLTFQFFNELTP